MWCRCASNAALSTAASDATTTGTAAAFATHRASATVGAAAARSASTPAVTTGTAVGPTAALAESRRWHVLWRARRRVLASQTSVDLYSND